MGLGKFRAALSLATALVAAPVWADTPASPSIPTLEQQFRDPPASARPRVWWHWMNGNISRDGIAKDLDWMARMGLGGVQMFDANLNTPQIVPHRLVYMTPEWKDTFRFAASEADRLGLEFGIASSPGWSETGGPWVPAEDGMKKLVWSETLLRPGLAPGTHFAGALSPPPSIAGPYQALAKAPTMDEILNGQRAKPTPAYYADVAVLAMPVAITPPMPLPEARDGTGAALDAAALADPAGKGVDLPRIAGQVPTLTLSYPAAQTVRSLRLFIPGASGMFTGPAFQPRLEASMDGAVWTKIADIALAEVPTTISFAPVTAKSFRLVLAPMPFSMANMPAGGNGVAAGEIFAGAAKAAASRPVHITEFALSGTAQVDRAEAKAGFALVPDYYALGDPGDGASGPAPSSVVDITAHMHADGTLDWTPPALPAGQAWRVIRLGSSLLGTTNHPATPEATGLEVDKFDAPAVQRYIDHYLSLYAQAAGADLMGAHGIRAIVTDSTEVGAANWTPGMIAQFRRLRGYDPMPWLPTLTGALVGSRAATDRFLYDFRRTIADLTASAHYATVDNAARKAGLTVYGEALEDHRPSLGDDIAMRTHADVPMSAMWTFPEGGSPRASYLADTKGASSIAHIYGQNLAAAESMTSMLTPWADSPRTLKHVIDLEFLQGINRPVIHESTHQPVDDKVPGLSLSVFGQYFNRHDSWAEMARPWVDYIARNSLLLQQGRNVADVAYFYGEEAPLTGLYGDTPVADAPRQNAYDFVNADALMGALRNDGADLASVGGARYRVLYLGGSSRRMTLATLRRIAALVDGGATVVGMAPEASPSEADAGSQAEYDALVAKLWPAGGGRVIASTDIASALEKAGVAPDFAFTGGSAAADIPFVHRALKDGDDYFLVNRGAHAETIEAHFRTTGKAPELWHADTGTSEAASYRIEGAGTVVPLSLAPGESLHVMFVKPATGPSRVVAKPGAGELAKLDGAWNVAFQPGRGAPASAVLPALAPLNENADPGIRYFSGIATYARDFTAPKGWHAGRPLWLDLGEVREIAEVSVNGVKMGASWHAPYRLNIGGAVHGGRNHLHIRVANLWVNRLVGDAQPGVAQKITWTALPSYLKTAPLAKSGLIGPVRLLGE